MRSTRNQGRGGAYNSSPRNFRRGGNYRRGGQKPHFPSSSSFYPPPPPPPPPLPPPTPRRKVIMEAGKLATEYLVSKGILPQSVLPHHPPSRWMIASGSSQEFKGRDRENMQYDRVSALNRLGGVDTGTVRRRCVDDGEEFDDGVGPRSSMRGRRRRRGVDDYNHDNGSYGGNGQWRSRESWMDRSRSFNDSAYGDTDDFSPGYRRGGSDFGDFSGGRIGERSDGTTDEVNLGNDVVMQEMYCNFQEEPAKNISNTKKESMEEKDGNFNKVEDDSRIHMEMEEHKSAKSSSDMGKEEEENSDNSGGVSKQGLENDSMKLPIFTKVPTKPRSMVVTKILKAEPDPVSVDALKNKVDQQGGTDNGYTCDVDKLSAGLSSSNQIMDLAPNPTASSLEETERKSFQHIKEQLNEKKSSVGSLSLERSFSSVQPRTESKDVIEDSVFDIETKVYTKSSSFPERSSPKQNQMGIKQVPAFEKKMEDGFLLHDAESEGAKRQRDWSSSVILHDDDYLQVRNLRPKHSSSSGQISMPEEEIVVPVDQKKLVNVDMFPKTEQDASMNFKEEKDILSNSFKICDLNLSESHDATEVHNDVPKKKPGTNPKMEIGNVPTMDFGLSVGHNNNDSTAYGQCSSDNKMIQVINLEDDSSGEDGACDLPQPK